MFFTNFPLERSFDSSRRFSSLEVFLALLAWSVEPVQLTSYDHLIEVAVRRFILNQGNKGKAPPKVPVILSS